MFTRKIHGRLLTTRIHRLKAQLGFFHDRMRHHTVIWVHGLRHNRSGPFKIELFTGYHGRGAIPLIPADFVPSSLNINQQKAETAQRNRTEWIIGGRAGGSELNAVPFVFPGGTVVNAVTDGGSVHALTCKKTSKFSFETIH